MFLTQTGLTSTLVSVLILSFLRQGPDSKTSFNEKTHFTPIQDPALSNYMNVFSIVPSIHLLCFSTFSYPLYHIFPDLSYRTESQNSPTRHCLTHDSRQAEFSSPPSKVHLTLSGASFSPSPLNVEPHCDRKKSRVALFLMVSG